MTQPNKSFQKTGKDTNDNKDVAKSAREIESEIAETRSAISSDIKDLNDKFTPSNVKEQAKEVMGGVKDAAVEQTAEMKDAVVDKAIEVKDAVVDKAVEVKDALSDKAVELKDSATETVVEVKEAVVETMQEVGEQATRAGSATWRFTKANAVPLALLGVGAGMMISNARRSKPEVPRYLAEESEDAWEYGEAGYVGATRASPQARRGAIVAGGRTAVSEPRTSKRASISKSNGGRMGSRAQEVVSQAAEGLEHAGNAAMDKASRGAELVQDKASDSYEYVQRNLRRAGTASRDFATANPLLTALAAVAAGVGLGMLLPATERENKLLAPPREKFRQLIGDVREAATDVAQVAKDTATDSMQAMK